MTLVTLASHALRGAALFGGALLLMPVLRGTAASVRRFVLVTALAAALLAPLAAAFMPAWHLGSPAFSVPLMASAPFAEAPVAATSEIGHVAPHVGAAGIATAGSRALPFSLPEALFALWLFGALVVVARAGAALLSAHRVVRAASPLADPTRDEWADAIQREAGARARILVSEEIGTPAVAGIFRPVVLMPAASLEWSYARWRVVLLHELAHVAQRDGLAYLLAELACAVHWFDPLAWIATRRLSVERELAADDRVLRAGVRATSFADHLVAVAAGDAHGRLPEAALGIGRHAQLGTRIHALVAAERARGPLSRRTALTVGLLGAGAASVVACARPAAEGAASSQRAEKPEVAAARADAPAVAVTRTARDPRLQAMAEEETDKLVAEWKTSLAAILVLDPTTGAVLAMTGYTSEGHADIATTRALEAASTIKPLVVAAALEEGAITANQRFSCDHGARAYGEKVLHDVGAYGTLDVTQILAVSSNVGASRIFDAIGPAKLQRRFTAFHLGERLGLGTPNEAAGDISRLGSGDAWGSMLVAIGHGMTATPMQMAAAYAALANGGIYHRPTFTGESDAGERVVREETARTVLTMMEQVVEGENGTGNRAHVDGVRVAGKTGTAEYPGAAGKTVHYGSFIGAVPAERPRYVIVVDAEVPGRDDASGGSVAAPVFARVAARALGR